MSTTLNNVETTNAYPSVGGSAGVQAAIKETAAMVVAEIDVYNAAVFVSLKVASNGEAGQAEWQDELFVAPSHRVLTRRYIFGIRFRSAKEGTPAQVTAELIPFRETFLGALLPGVGS